MAEVMTDRFIEKHPQRQDSADFTALRAAGITHIEKLASNLWTDYNVHDPGITILEMLCYAITDLAFRTQYSIPDILAEALPEYADDDETDSPEQKEPKQFFTAREILVCNPVTQHDFRKLMIDVPGVKNAWLELVDDPQPPLYLDCKHSKLTLAADDKFEMIPLQGLYDVILELENDAEAGDLNIYYFEADATDGSSEFSFTAILPNWQFYFTRRLFEWEVVEVKFDGALTDEPDSRFYNGSLTTVFKNGGLSESFTHDVVIEVDRDKTGGMMTAVWDELKKITPGSVTAFYKSRIEKSLSIAGAVYKKLHAHRPLCEDFYCFKAIEVEEISVCADLEVTPETDIETALAQVYYEIGRFFSPAVYFYTLQEMLDKGKTTEEIFLGPTLNHGFIDDDELRASTFKKAIRVSDLIQIIMDVPGVVAVKNIQITSYFNGETVQENERWCLPVSAGRAASLSIDRSKIVFYKGLFPYSANKAETEKLLKDIRGLERHPRLEAGEYDIPVPSGKSRNIQGYYSIQNDFPLTYGIGDVGLPLTAGDARRAQAKQLKAYLMFYDQLLANYFSQLAHTKDLLSMDAGVQRTYFGQPLFEIPGIISPDVPGAEILIKSFIDQHPALDTDDRSAVQAAWETYIATIAADYPAKFRERDTLIEDEKTYLDRRNRFLDHLMARFNEQFTDYVMLMFTLDRQKAPAELIEDKVSFLNDYPVISRDRGKGFNYTDAMNLWDSGNVSGLQKRVARLLGIRDFSRRNLRGCPNDLFIIEPKDADAVEYRFRLENAASDILLSGPKGYPSKADAAAAIQAVAENISKRRCYDLKTTVDGRFYFNLIDAAGATLARRIEYFLSEAERNAAIEEILDLIETHCEGFFLLEHILLRPQQPFFCGEGGGGETVVSGFEIYQETDDDGIDEYRFRLRDSAGNILISSSTRYYSVADAVAEIQAVVFYLPKRENYQLLPTIDGRFYFNLIDDSGEVIARRIEYFENEAEREAAIDAVIAFANLLIDTFHLEDDPGNVPVNAFGVDLSAHRLFTVCVEEDCETCTGFIDPYSFRATVVVPYWPQRFRSSDFRRFFEQTIRREAPAHVHVKVCWVSQEALAAFENAYRPWLAENAKSRPDRLLLNQLRDNLLEVLESLRSVYPAVQLHDCEESDNENPILLNHSILGTTERDDNGNL